MPTSPPGRSSFTKNMFSESCPCEESEVSELLSVLMDVVSDWARELLGPGKSIRPPALPSLGSRGYRRVWEVLLTSLSSREMKDGEWLVVAAEALRPSVQLQLLPECCRWAPPMRQKRHLTFSMALLSTVLRSRMYTQGSRMGLTEAMRMACRSGFFWMAITTGGW